METNLGVASSPAAGGAGIPKSPSVPSTAPPAAGATKPDEVIPGPKVKCTEADCGQEFPNSGLLAAHKSRDHGLGAAKKTRARKRAAPREVTIDRPPPRARGGQSSDEVLAAKSARDRQEQAARAARRNVRQGEVERFILGDGNNWLLEGGCWFVGLPKATVEQARLVQPDGTEVNVRDQLVLTARQAKVLSEAYVRVEESSLGARLAEMVERLAPWALIAGGVAVIGVHMVKLNQMRMMMQQIAAAQQKLAADSNGNGNGVPTNLGDLSQFLTPENIAKGMEAMRNMSPKPPAGDGEAPAGGPDPGAEGRVA